MRTSRRYRQLGARVLALAALGLLAACSLSARASVAVLLEEPYGDLGVVDPAGHVAVYLDHVCAETPVKLRPCRAGELGVVISRYDGIGHVDWMAVPLIPYLYAVDDARDIPVAVQRKDVEQLRDAYRRSHLEQFAPDLPTGAAPAGNWYELAGAAFDRAIYGFQVNSTPEQDAQLIAQFNDHKNTYDYNGAFRNCADFARITINSFYPHAVRRNYVADFGLTSPKSVARGLTHYAGKHPELGLQAFVIAQISGDARRSFSPEGLAEGIIKHFGVPLLVVSPATTALLAAAYVSHGRFAEPRNAPVLNLRAGLKMENAINRVPAAPDSGVITATIDTPPYPNPSARFASVALPAALAAPTRAATVTGTLVKTTLVNGLPE